MLSSERYKDKKRKPYFLPTNYIANPESNDPYQCIFCGELEDLDEGDEGFITHSEIFICSDCAARKQL